MKKLLSFCCSVICAVVMSAENWGGYKGAAAVPPSVTPSKSAESGTEYLVKVEAPGAYQGVVISFPEPVDLQKYAAVEFEISHNLTKKALSLALRFDQNCGVIQGKLTVPDDKWHKVAFQFIPENFVGDGCRNGSIGICKELDIYPYSLLDNIGEYIKIRNFRLVSKNDARMSRTIPVLSYRYLAAPTDGDTSRSALTDGDKKANVYYREYSDDPQIQFDLGSCYSLDSLTVDAFTAPSHNFSNIAVTASIDGKDWYAGGTIVNKETGTEARAASYSFQPGKHPVVGRYFMLRFARPRPDYSIHFSEVSFKGHTPSAAELQAAAEQNYDIGPVMPERNAENYAELKSGDWQLWISRQNGVVNGVIYQGKLLVERFAARYTLQSRAKDTEISGYDDHVERIEPSGNSVKVTTTNSKLPGLAVERIWHVEGNTLWEKVSVINRNQQERLFLQLATETILAQAFRAPGFYEMPGTAIYTGMFRFPTSEIHMDRAVTNIPCLALENRQTQQTVWHSRHRFNDRMTYFDVGTEEDNLQVLRANGWLMTYATIVPADKPVQSYETRFAVTAGGMLKAYDEYIHLPEVKAFRERIQRSPAVRDIRMSIDAGWDGAWPLGRKRAMSNYTRAFSHRGTLSDCELVDMDGIWGDLPTAGPLRGNFGERRNAEELRQSLRNLKASDSRFRLGLYTWFWSAFPWSSPVKNHPEWFVKTLRNGAGASWFPRVNVNYLRFWGIPESRQEAVDQVARFMDFYEQDSWYVDGGKSGTYAKDWDTMRIDDPLGQTDFYMAVREAVRKNHPERFVVFNHSGNPIADMGFLESAGNILTAEWRRGAITVWKFKMYAYQDPLHQSIYVYWSPGVDGIYHNYIAGLGLLPNYNGRRFNARDLPYTGARYDIRLAEIRDADVAPDWRVDRAEELECMALAQQHNGWIFMQYHGEKPTVREVSADAAALGLNEPDKPVYLWHYVIRDAKKYQGIFGEPQIAEAYRKTGWVTDRGVTVEYLGKQPWNKRISGKFEQHRNEAQLLMASQIPAVVLSIENDPMHYYLAGQPGVTVDGNQNQLTVRNEYQDAEIGIILEDGKIPKSVTVNGQNSPFKIRTDRNFRCAVFNVGKGDSAVEFTYQTASPVTVSGLDAVCTDRRLKVNVTPEDAPVQIYSDDALVVSRVGSFTIELPETVRDGKYEIVAGSLKKTLTLNGLGKPLEILPVLPTLPEEQNIEAVNRKVHGIEVLQQAISYTCSAGEAKVEPDKLKLAVGTLPFYESQFNHASAALQMKVKNFLKIRIVNEAVEHTRFDYMPERHSIAKGVPTTFLGVILDFGTQSGKMTRSAAGLGQQSEKRAKRETRPNKWGTPEVPLHIYELLPMLYDPEFEERTCWIDLASLGAPADWNGEVWVTLHLENLSPDRRFQIEILETAEHLPPGVSCVTPTELGVQKAAVTYPIPRIAKPEDLKKIPVMGQMIPETGNSSAPLTTSVKAAYDDRNLYLFYDCRENDGHISDCTAGRRGEPYNGDSVEFFLQRTDHADQALHVIVDVEKHQYSETTAFRAASNKPRVALPSAAGQVKIKSDKPHWSALIYVPWSAIGGKPKAGAMLGFNMMRNRYEQGKASYYTLSSNGEYLSADQCRMILK